MKHGISTRERRRGRALGALALALLATLAAVPAAGAQTTIAVNSTADTTAPGDCATPAATCTLRDAIDAVGATPGDYLITVPSGHYVLTAGELDLYNDFSNAYSVTITGAGARSTVIDAAGNSRVLAQPSGTDSLTLSGLTLTGGAATVSSNYSAGDGGGLLFWGTGTLTLDHVAITGNTATLGGGGLFVPFEGPPATVNITASTIAGNKVTGGAANGQGGGMAVFGPLTITNSTVAGNSVSNPGINEGGGIVAAKSSNDQSTTPEPITLLNDTIAGNSVTGVTPATDFGGGLSGDNIAPAGPFDSNLHATNTVIAGNTVDGSEADCGLTNTGATDHNLSGDSSCGFTDAGSQQGRDARLAALANNGGPTDTMMPLAGSPLVDTGTNAGCPATDQIGTTRPQNGICDIGAVERIQRADLAVTATASPATVSAGQNVTYTITVANNGPDAAQGATLTDTLGPDQTLVSTTPSQGTCTGAAPITCALGTIPAGGSVTVVVVATTAKTPSTPPPSGGRVVTDTGTAATTTGDSNPGNDSATATARVAAVTTSASRAPTIRISRSGPRGCVAHTLALPVRITSATRLTRVRVALNGRVILRTTRGRFTVRLPARRLRRGRNVLVVTATNRSGRTQRRRIAVTRCGAARRVAPRFTG